MRANHKHALRDSVLHGPLPLILSLAEPWLGAERDYYAKDGWAVEWRAWLHRFIGSRVCV